MTEDANKSGSNCCREFKRGPYLFADAIILSNI